jgi:hypothetical protein
MSGEHPGVGPRPRIRPEGWNGNLSPDETGAPEEPASAGAKSARLQATGEDPLSRTQRGPSSRWLHHAGDHPARDHDATWGPRPEPQLSGAVDAMSAGTRKGGCGNGDDRVR